MTGQTPAPDILQPALFRLSAALYVQRDGQILLLKRAVGEGTGAWYPPGGGVDAGEDIEDAARRELFEEAGLAPNGALTPIGVVQMHVYGFDSLQVFYACDCPEGEVTLSDEHSAARWMEPRAYRDRYFNDDVIAVIRKRDERMAANMLAIRRNLDAYLAWREHRFLDQQLREMRLTADVFVVRDGKILLLKRRGGIGDGVWYLPGGVVDRGEDPADAAVRETLEESGLRVENVRLLRVWGYPAQNGIEAYHVSYICEAPEGEVVLSHEHSNYRWMTPLEYAERYCNEQVEAAAPQWSRWLQQVRLNCELVQAQM